MKLKTICLASIALLIAACGGGGGGSASVVDTNKTITGQVVKGPVEGATVDLYLLSDSGSKTMAASTKSVANGKFDFTSSLSAGKVYLLESIGGTYVDEVSKQPATLSTKLRAVFVAPTTTAKITVSPLTELVLMDIDASVLPDKWLASSVATTSSKVAQALGVDSTTGMNYIDLANLTEAAAATATEADISFSFQISLFSGIVNEVKHRNTSATITDAFKAFYSIILEENADDSVGSIFAASLIRTVDSMPFLKTNGARADILNAAGLPSDASLAVFEGAESSGGGEAIPNYIFKMLRPANYDSYPSTSQTIFNSRGALVAYSINSQNEESNYTYLGSGSVSNVYKNADVTIGKWNNGYYYPSNVTINKNTQNINTHNFQSSPINSDLDYLAYASAYNMPNCGVQVSTLLKANKPTTPTTTSEFISSIEYNSKISFRDFEKTGNVADNHLYFGYNLYFKTKNGNIINITNEGGIQNPNLGIDYFSQVGKIDGNNVFYINLPSIVSEDNKPLKLLIHGVRAGNAGKTTGVVVVITDENNVESRHYSIFTADNIQQPCFTANFQAGAFSPTPTTNSNGFYYLTAGDSSTFGMSFLADGTPQDILSPNNLQGTYEKRGNNYVGVGIAFPEFGANIFSVKHPIIYSYFRRVYPPEYIPPNYGSPVLGGVTTYNLIASTPYIKRMYSSIISSEYFIKNGKLKTFINQYPVGVFDSYYSTCQISLNDDSIIINGTYEQNTGVCNSDASSSGGIFRGGVSGSNRDEAVIHFSRIAPPYFGEAGLIFKKTN